MTAIILGATGLTGSWLLELLLNDERFDEVRALVRRATGVQHPKLRELLVDFDQPDTWQAQVSGDVLFAAFGTTRSRAGGKTLQYKVDYTYQYRVAQVAAENGVKALVLVSSSGADASSAFFYLRMKGELDRDVQQLPFERVRILRPGVLEGLRREHRPLEHYGTIAIKTFNQVGLFRKYRPIHVRNLAKAMIESAMDNSPGVQIYESEAVFALAEQDA